MCFSIVGPSGKLRCFACSASLKEASVLVRHRGPVGLSSGRALLAPTTASLTRWSRVVLLHHDGPIQEGSTP